MESKEFARRGREKQPVLAICYDFDKTLSPDDMQAQGYIQSLQYEVDSFWKESNELARRNDMDQNLAYMYKMVHEAEGRILLRGKNCSSMVPVYGFLTVSIRGFSAFVIMEGKKGLLWSIISFLPD